MVYLTDYRQYERGLVLSAAATAAAAAAAAAGAGAAAMPPL